MILVLYIELRISFLLITLLRKRVYFANRALLRSRLIFLVRVSLHLLQHCLKNFLDNFVTLTSDHPCEKMLAQFPAEVPVDENIKHQIQKVMVLGAD